MAIPRNLPKYNFIKGLWRFEETSGTVVRDFSDTTHSGTASRTQILGGAAGVIGNCGTFVAASSDKVTITDHSDLKPTGNFSACFWLKTSTTATGKRLFGSQAYAGSVFAGFATYIGTDNYPNFLIADNAGHNSCAKKSINVCDGNWHLISNTWDGSNIKQYVDDSTPNSAAYAYNPAYQATNYVKIGVACHADDEFMNGSLDEVILWNGAALTAAEVLTLYAITFYRYGGGFSGGQPWIFMKDAWEKHNKIWKSKGLILPKEGFSY